MLPKAHLTSHSKISGSRWVTTISWLSRSLRSFLYSTSLYYCHLFLISSASGRSCFGPLLSSSLLEMFPWLSLIFFKRFLSSIQLLNRVWLCDPMDCSMPGFPVHHQLPELTQTHVFQVGDAIQPSHPLSFPSPVGAYMTTWRTIALTRQILLAK